MRYANYRRTYSRKWSSAIYTNAVDLAKKIDALMRDNIVYEINIVKGIDGEDVVKLLWDQEMIERRIEALESEMKENHEIFKEDIDRLRAI